jgi:hypothetical protein
MHAGHRDRCGAVKLPRSGACSRPRSRCECSASDTSITIDDRERSTGAGGSPNRRPPDGLPPPSENAIKLDPTQDLLIVTWRRGHVREDRVHREFSETDVSSPATHSFFAAEAQDRRGFVNDTSSTRLSPLGCGCLVQDLVAADVSEEDAAPQQVPLEVVDAGGSPISPAEALASTNPASNSSLDVGEPPPRSSAPAAHTGHVSCLVDREA